MSQDRLHCTAVTRAPQSRQLLSYALHLLCLAVALNRVIFALGPKGTKKALSGTFSLPGGSGKDMVNHKLLLQLLPERGI